MTFTNVVIGPLSRILLFVPLLGAIVATIALTKSRNRINDSEDANLIEEVRAVRLGFLGKTAMQVTTSPVSYTHLTLPTSG